MMDVNDIAWLQLNKFCSLDFKIVGMACQVFNDIVWLQMCITSYIIDSKLVSCNQAISLTSIIPFTSS